MGKTPLLTIPAKMAKTARKKKKQATRKKAKAIRSVNAASATSAARAVEDDSYEYDAEDEKDTSDPNLLPYAQAMPKLRIKASRAMKAAKSADDRYYRSDEDEDDRGQPNFFPLAKQAIVMLKIPIPVLKRMQARRAEEYDCYQSDAEDEGVTDRPKVPGRPMVTGRPGFIPYAGGMPRLDIPASKKQVIEALPTKRQLLVIDAEHKTLNTSGFGGINKAKAAWIFVKGKRVTACPHCITAGKTTGAPFPYCVVLEGHWDNACASCFFTGESTHCKYKLSNAGMITEAAWERNKRLKDERFLHFTEGRNMWLENFKDLTASNVNILELAMVNVDHTNKIYWKFMNGDIESDSPETQLSIGDKGLTEYVKFEEHLLVLEGLTLTGPQSSKSLVSIFEDPELVRFLLSEFDRIYAALLHHPLFMRMKYENKTTAVQRLVEIINRRYTYFVRFVLLEYLMRKEEVVKNRLIHCLDIIELHFKLVELSRSDKGPNNGFIAKFSRGPKAFKKHNSKICEYWNLS